jgi:hypothetical protein
MTNKQLCWIIWYVQNQIHSRTHTGNLRRFFGVLYGLKAASTKTAVLQSEVRSAALYSNAGRWNYLPQVTQ